MSVESVQQAPSCGAEEHPVAMDCGQCQRRNNDDAIHCLYCGFALEPREPAPDGRRNNPHHLVWIPGEHKDENTGAALQEILEVDAFRARLLAQSAVPRILRTMGDASGARELHQRAHGRGLCTFLVDEHTLETHPEVEPVEEVRVDGGKVVLEASSGSFEVPPRSVELLVTSRVMVRRVRNSSRISMFSSEPGATPGIPQVVKESRTTQDHRGVLDLYPAGDQRALRVREESTLLFGDGLPAQPSSLLRFLHLVEVMRGLLPSAAYDDRFALFDDLDMDQAQRVGAGTGVTVLDGITRFARYSRLLWMARRAPDVTAPE
jgi:hypothetical protein